jgi:protein KTI12
MPLLVISGLPLSGKTTWALALQAHLKATVINDESLGIDPKVAYSSPTLEKQARGLLMSAIERTLTRNDIVICDGLNYIKGFRYQLYCVARALGTPTCTLYCGSESTDSLQRNLTLQRYDQSILENLCSRFEEPDGRNRWDKPLFIVISQDSPAEHQVLDQIKSALSQQAPNPNLSTVVKPITDANFVHQMDSALNEILDALIYAQKNGMNGLTNVPKSQVQVALPARFVSLQEWRRLKRQYGQMTKLHVQSDLQKTIDGFVGYINTNFA